jgi:hypothetical protein
MTLSDKEGVVPVVFQHKPLAVTVAPPSEATVAVPAAELAVIPDVGNVILLTDGAEIVMASRRHRTGLAVALFW